MDFSLQKFRAKIPFILRVINTTIFAIVSLVILKTIFQVVIIKNGLRWLTADDYCRTVISYDWLQHPKIYAGVWLSMHFWINGIFIAIFKDLTLAPIIANTFFSILTLIYLYLLFIKIFNKTIAYLSCLIYIVFPFQVWLSNSGMPESIFFFFITTSCYYFVVWYETLGDAGGEKKNDIYFALSIISLNLANLLRYEGWLFQHCVYNSYRSIIL